ELSSVRAAAIAARLVCDRHRVLLLLAAFAFQVCPSIRVALVDPPMHADHAQKFPHDRHTPPAKACALAPPDI
ncbi:MAG: hypothetical protein ABW156_08445, partial [Jiangellaceae bacterium]